MHRQRGLAGTRRAGDQRTATALETATEQLSSMIEPILIVGLGVVIGGMVVSLYLPIFTLYSDISNSG